MSSTLGRSRAPRVGHGGHNNIVPGAGSILGRVQDRDLLQLLTRNLYSLHLHVIAHAEFVDGDELIATGLMAKVTSPAPPAFARMTEPSQEPGWRPHLSILTDLICPSYGCTFAAEAPPAMTEATGAKENTAQSSHASMVLILFMDHLPHATHRQLCVPSLPNLALTLIYT
jgi:hypothetical protein